MIDGLVSTIIPVYNRAAMLREAVASVLAQTYRPIEIIIVDDGSTDDTPAAAAELAAAHSEVRVLTQANGGPGRARETGRRAIRGEFVQHLDSDDLLDPQKFALQVAALRAHSDCGVAYCKARFQHADGTVDPRPSRRTGERFETMFPAMLLSRVWETAAPLYRASLVGAAGPWMPLSAEEDWEFDSRIAAGGVRLCFVDDWLCTTRRHASNISGHLDVRTLRDRATAHAEIIRHARAAGISEDSPEMQHFARELFLLARQCGAAGLAEQSAMLFELARNASGANQRLQLRVYGLLARVAGWRAAGKLSDLADRMRR